MTAWFRPQWCASRTTKVAATLDSAARLRSVAEGISSPRSTLQQIANGVNRRHEPVTARAERASVRSLLHGHAELKRCMAKWSGSSLRLQAAVASWGGARAERASSRSLLFDRRGARFLFYCHLWDCRITRSEPETRTGGSLSPVHAAAPAEVELSLQRVGTGCELVLG